MNKRTLLSLFLVFCLIFSTSVNASNISTTSNTSTYSGIITQFDTKSIKELVEKLDPEAKKIFLALVSSDPKLKSYHLSNIDKNYKQTLVNTTNEIYAATANPLTVLNAELVALNLSVTVRYALNAIGASLVTAGIDGPIPVGDVIGIVIALGAGAVLAANWSEVQLKWPAIVSAFKKAFSSCSSKVSELMYGLEVNISQTLTPPYTKIDDNTYQIKTKSNVLVITRDKNPKPKCFFAVRNPKGGINIIMPITMDTAVRIMMLGYQKMYCEGVYCPIPMDAKTICSRTAYPGFLDNSSLNKAHECVHYHPGNPSNKLYGTHAWIEFWSN